MLKNKDDVEKLKTLLDNVSPYEKGMGSTVTDNNYVKSVYERLHTEETTQTMMTQEAKIPSKPSGLKPKVGIHPKKKEETSEEKTAKEETTTREEEPQEFEEEQRAVELEITYGTVKPPDFIKIVPKEKTEERKKFTRVEKPEEELPEWEAIEEEPFEYKGYTLYRRIVKLKSGKTQPIYFFSKKKPKSGEPTSLPEKYTVGINKRSGMPYLKTKDKVDQKKEEKEEIPYEINGYRLYVREVELKSGKTQPIYFFSKKKPKSGKPTALPKKYEVGINQRSNMPYLKKRKMENKAEIEKEEKIDEMAKKKPSNVIYVVSKPQPGQVRGDWAVRSHHKIYSHHRTKDNAIKAARKIARKKEATVLVQKTDGAFTEGFKPKTK